MAAGIERLRTGEAAAALAAAEVRAGLLARPPRLPSKYFYDARGCRLFEAITRSPEYYLTRAEERILEAAAGEVARLCPARELVELGSGTSSKVRVLLRALAAEGRLERCLLLDASEPALSAALPALRSAHPGMEVRAIVGDFLTDLAALGTGGGRLLLFLASTVGNLHPDRELPVFLRAVAAGLAVGDAFLLGVDLVKDPARLHAAYNDAAGITAEFNRNMLRAVNAGLGADFQPDAFEHVAFYDPERAWIEMRLRATRAMRVAVPRAGLELRLSPGDEIHTEISCKYTRAALEGRLAGSGLRVERWFTDPEGLFADVLLRRVGP
jgi:L-histidine N-alpha-methyltransferase